MYKCCYVKIMCVFISTFIDVIKLYKWECLGIVNVNPEQTRTLKLKFSTDVSSKMPGTL